MAVPAPYDRARFLSDAWIDEVLDLGFDVGRPHGDPEASSRCLDSVDRMIDDLAEDLGFDPDDPVAVRRAVAGWMPLRLAYVEARLAEDERTDDGLLVCTRILNVDERTMRGIVEDGDWPGEYWSAGGGAHAYWGSADAGPELVLTAHLDTADVDWEATVARRMNYLLGDDEREIALRRDARVRIVEATWGGEDATCRRTTLGGP